MRRPALALTVALAVAATVLAACGSSGTTASTASLSASRKPLPAGPTPSSIAKQVCSHEAQREIAADLGVRAAVSAPTWEDHLYSCVYQYPEGSFTMSVKELSSWSQTFAYYRQVGAGLGPSHTIANLGQGAYQVADGSVVVRKDWKVLTVDVSHLPATFGVPPTSAGDNAVSVAIVILDCWAGD